MREPCNRISKRHLEPNNKEMEEMNAIQHGRFSRIFLVLTVGLACGLMVVGQSEAQVRQQLPPGKDTNWVPPEGPGSRAIATWQLGAVGPTGIVTPEKMVEELFCGSIPPGVAVANETFNGVNRAGGIFTGGGFLFNYPAVAPPPPPWEGPVGIPQGVILSSGNIASVVGGFFGRCNRSDSTSTRNNQPGDLNLDAIVAPRVTFDRAALEFDIWVTDEVDHILGFRFVFGSEEYNEWVFTAFRDACGIFISPSPLGNYALVPPGGGGAAWLPVTVDDVNGGNPYQPSPPTSPSPNYVASAWGTNPKHYVNNDPPDGGLPGRPMGPPERETELDGLTEDNTMNNVPLVFRSQPFLMAPDQVYHVKLVVADTSDYIYDSDLFVKGTVVGGYCCVCGGHCADVPTLSCETTQDCLDQGASGPCISTCACIDGVSQEECEDPDQLDGTWGEGLLCGEGPCGGTGACCDPGTGNCTDGETIESCAAGGGEYVGDGTVCSPDEACCYPDESCDDLPPECCPMTGGQPMGSGTICTTTDCTVYGACCTEDPEPECTLVPDESACVAMDGDYQGEGTVCPAACEIQGDGIPAVSEWGLVLLTLIGLATGTILFRRRRQLSVSA